MIVETDWGRAARAAALVAVGFAVLGGCSRSAPTGPESSTQSAGGFTVYLGVVPAALVKGHDPGTPGAMHPNETRDSASHHVMVAIFDAATGVRVTVAAVTATVRQGTGLTTTKPLELMVVDGAATFGNYFPLAEDGTRTAIDVDIRCPPPARAATVHFSYSHGP